MKLDFNNIIIYGPKLHQHINSWMFYGFYRAFVYKRYNVIWVNSESANLLDNYDLSNSLFFTDNIHDENIPLRSDGFYLLFNNYKSKYDDYNKLHINIYRNDIGNYQKWKDLDYIRYSLDTKELFFPMATELLPEEILDNQKRKVLTNINNMRSICVLNEDVKTNSYIFAEIKKVCNKNYFKMCLINNLNSDERINHVIQCQVAPIIHSQDQIDHNEIDSSIFQIISYGGFPVTNSEYTAKLFSSDCVYYSDNAEDMIIKGIEHKNEYFMDLCKWLVMDDVKKNHTYVKRLDTIFWMLLRM